MLQRQNTTTNVAPIPFNGATPHTTAPQAMRAEATPTAVGASSAHQSLTGLSRGGGANNSQLSATAMMPPQRAQEAQSVAARRTSVRNATRTLNRNQSMGEYGEPHDVSRLLLLLLVVASLYILL